LRLDEPIIVYSPFSAEEDRTPEQAEATYDQCHAANRWDGDNYLPLPWTMQDLVGANWRNVHTGSLAMASPLQRNPAGELQLTTQLPGGYPWPLGHWYSHLYVVEHWLRVDHLSLEEQLVWFGFRVGWLREKIVWEKQQLTTLPHTTQGPVRAKMKERLYEEQCLLDAESQMQLFAQHHHLSIPPEILDYKVEPYEQRWDRIALLSRKQPS
jgi:hypothetical protein